jgi:superfamily I DNA and RNA helicase
LLTSFSANGIDPARVTVLTGHSVQSSALARYAEEPLGSFRLRSSPSRANDVRFESVHRFKGLEAPVVVLCEMEHLHAPARRSVWYTGLSRAQIGLVVLLRDEDDTLQGCDIDSALEAVLADD